MKSGFLFQLSRQVFSREIKLEITRTRPNTIRSRTTFLQSRNHSSTPPTTFTHLKSCRPSSGCASAQVSRTGTTRWWMVRWRGGRRRGGRSLQTKLRCVRLAACVASLMPLSERFSFTVSDFMLQKAEVAHLHGIEFEIAPPPKMCQTHGLFMCCLAFELYYSYLLS